MAVSTWNSTGSGSWRSTDGWRVDSDDVYQGQWSTTYGHYRGLWIFNDASIRATLAGQEIISVRLRMTRRDTTHGSAAAGIPTVRLHNYGAEPTSGTPTYIAGSSNHGASFVRGQADWCELSPAWGEALRDGSARGLGVYTTSNSPYLVFTPLAILEITYEPSIDAPPTPTGFSLDSATGSSISMSCNVAGSTAGNNLASHYRFDREGGGSSLQPTNSFVNSGLPNGYQDRWRVRAENPGGVSAYTSWLTGITIPSTPGNLGHVSSTTSTITMDWDAVNGAYGYRVHRSGAGELTTGNTSLTWSSLSPGTSYQFRVRAESQTPNGTGGNSNYSSWVTLWTAPVAPTTPSVSELTHDSVKLDWNTIAGANNYRVERRVAGGIFSLVVNTSSTSFEDIGLTEGQTYEYRVRAEGAGGVSGWSGTRSITTVPPPDTPPGLSVTSVDTDFINLQWTPVAGAALYRVQRLSLSMNIQGNWTSNDVSFTDNTVQPGTSYYYRVRSESNLGGVSNYSGVVRGDSAGNPQQPPRLADVGNFNAGSTQVFEWEFDTENFEDAQVERHFQVRRVSDSVVVVDAVAETSDTAYTVSSGTLPNNVQYEWRVRTRDSVAAVLGPWSNYKQFETISPPAVTVTTPLPGGSHAGQVLSVAWTYSQSAARPQSEFIVLAYSAGEIKFDSGWIQSSSNTYSIPGLESGTYDIYVKVGSGGVESSFDIVSSIGFSSNTTIIEEGGPDVVWLNNDDGTQIGDGVFRFNMESPTTSGIETYHMFPKGNGWQKAPGPAPTGRPGSEGWKAVLDIEQEMGSNIVLSFEAKVEDKSGNLSWDNIGFPSAFQLRVYTTKGTWFTSSPILLDGDSYDSIDLSYQNFNDIEPKYRESDNGYRRYATSISSRHPVERVELFANFSPGASPRYLYITNLDVHRSGLIYSEEFVESGFEGGLMLSGDGYMSGYQLELFGRAPSQNASVTSFGMYFPKAYIQSSGEDRSYFTMSTRGSTERTSILLYDLADTTGSYPGSIVMRSQDEIWLFAERNVIVRARIENSWGNDVTPAYTFEQDTDTGIFRYNANTMGFTTNGAAKFYLDPDGRLVSDIGNLNPATGFGNQNAVGLYSGGFLLISRATDPAVQINRGSTGPSQVFRQNGTTVGTISVTSSATAYNTSSDYRLKTDEAPIQNALGRIEKLRPVEFTWIRDQQRDEGFIAHEAMEAIPNAVIGEKDAVTDDGEPDYQMIDYSRVVPLLTAAVKELSAKVEELELRAKG